MMRQRHGGIMDSSAARAIEIVSDTYPDHLRRAFRSEFGLNLYVEIKPSAGFCKSRADGEELEYAQLKWLGCYEIAYFTALEQFREAS